MAQVQDVLPEDIPLPNNTASMVTVRLSTESTSIETRPRSESEASDSLSICTTSSKTSAASEASAASPVDWEELEKEEEQEPKDDATDDSTALLLARLETANAALTADPKAAAPKTRPRRSTRPPSMHHLKKLVDGPQPEALRYSMLPAPQMTELEFWGAVVQDYHQTVQRLPTLTSNKIRGGVPPPLRGVVWPSIANARDAHLHAEFQRLANEPSPYDGIIGKDVGRSFPNVDMFREAGGEGQRMLGRVLKAFSLHDEAIGYCQGLGFVAGPLLMHMSEPEAFCILVRLMEHYDLRSSYLPSLTGLHLKIYQFSTLLKRHLPELAAHLDNLNIEPIYVSQWFLSFFSATCPLPMLLRIYDVLLSEGATETLMRVALSLMQRNEAKLKTFTEIDEIMPFLLGRQIWDTYAQHADDLVQSFVSLTPLVEKEALKTLELEFQQSQAQNIAPQSSLKSAAASLLGRFWAGSAHLSSKSGNLSLMIPATNLRKSSSGNSLTSTINSINTVSDASTLATDVSEDGMKRATSFGEHQTPSKSADRDYHSQIEDLLTALSHLQRQQSQLTEDLRREREERAEDVTVARELLSKFRAQTDLVHELAGGELDEADTSNLEFLEKAAIQFDSSESQRQTIIASKHTLSATADAWQTRYEAECERTTDLQQQLTKQEDEHRDLRDHLRDARARIQDAHREKQRLERTVQDLRTRQPPTPDSPSDMYTPITPANEMGDLKMPPPKAGLREFKLGRTATDNTRPASVVFSKRSSSLVVAAVLANSSGDSPQEQQQASNDALLLELVNAKTAEAVARQELEETRGKLDALRKIMSGASTSSSLSSVTRVVSGSDSSATAADAAAAAAARPKPVHAATAAARPSIMHTPSSSLGNYFSGWGRRS